MNILKLLGLGLGGYLLYEYWTGASSSVASTVAASGSIPASSVPIISAAQLTQAAAANHDPNTLTIWQWNYYYQNLTGRSTANIDPNVLIGSTTGTVDAATYLSLIQSAGLGGLGMILDLQKVFAGVPVEQGGFGDQEFTAAGMAGFRAGLGVIVSDPNNSAGYIDEPPFLEAAAFGGSQDSTTTDFYLAVQGQGS